MDTKFENSDSGVFKISSFWAILGIILLVISLVFLFNIFDFSTSFAKNFSLSKHRSLQELAQVGDMIGGIVGTLFGVSGTILIYATFVQQSENFKKERFENRFFELAKAYRDTVNEMNIADVRIGRKCFVPMYKELINKSII